MVAALVLAGAWAYSTSFRGALVLDDTRGIALNASIRSLDTALQPPDDSTVAGRPVANLTFALNYALAPGDVADNLWAYHALNLAIHAAAGLLLFGVVRRTLTRLAAGRDGGRTLQPPRASWLAFAIALLWLVHPLQTESVTYLVQRVESLAGLFFLLTLYCAIRSAEGRPLAWGAAAVVSCALGMATKEVMVGAPVVVVLWDWLCGPQPVPRSRRRLWAALAGTWTILAVLVFREHRGPSLSLDEGMVWRYLATQAGVIVHYVRLAAYPSPLVFLYTWPIAASFAVVWPQAVAVAALAALTVYGIVRRHPLAFTGAWFLVILAPTSSLLPIVTEVAAEHRMYLPLAAIISCAALAGAAGGGWLLRKLLHDETHRRHVGIASAAVILVGLAVALGAATRERNRDYWSEETLWRDTVEKQPGNPRARIAYGVALFGQRRLAEAEAQLQQAVRLVPYDPTAIGRLGAVLAAQGRFGEAVGHLQRAAELSGRRDWQVLAMLAAAQAEVGRFNEAVTAGAQALEIARERRITGAVGELERRLAAYRAMAAAR